MSVDILQPLSSPPLKRSRESCSQLSDVVSKCGELFVTKCADKWTFYCTYCQKATTDIGVFICHIRLEHLNNVSDMPEQQQPQFKHTSALGRNISTTIACPQQNNDNLVETATSEPIDLDAIDEEQPELQTESVIVKEETLVGVSRQTVDYEAIKVSKIMDISSLTQPESNEMDQSISNENNTATSTANLSEEIDEEFVALSPVATQLQQEKVIEVVYTENETIKEHEFDYSNDSATDSVCTLSEDESTKGKPAIGAARGASCSSSSSRKKRAQYVCKADRDLLPHKCPICHLGFKSRQGVHFHTLKIHDKNLHSTLPHKCQECNRGFKSLQGLKYHKVTHENKVPFKCPLCPATQYKLNIFINHVLTHESGNCFPCQVCGKIYASNAERVKHWQSHAKERPFGCKFCKRRFRKQQYLTHHLKAHNQYQCHFCPFVFNSAETQRPPYVCTGCEKLPDIKQKVEHLRSLADKSHVFDSDED